MMARFKDASPLSLSNDDRQGVQITFRDDGEPSVLAISAFEEQGKPLVPESPQKNRQCQRDGRL